jgi:hypothetical protein
MAVSTQKLLPQSKGGAIAKITPMAYKKSAGGEEKKDTIVVIKERCIEIDTLLKGSLALDKIRAEEARKKKQTQRRAASEKQLESRTKSKDEKKSGLKLPKIGFFDRIKNFIKNVLLGFILTRLVEFAPILQKIVPLLAGAIDFMTDFAIGLVNALGTFLKWGFDAYEKTEKFIEDIGGEDAVKEFNKFTSTLERFLNLALIAGLAAAAVSRENARQSRGGNLRGRSGGIPKGTRPGAVRRFAQRYGRDAAIKKFGKDAVTRFGGSAGRSAVTNLGRRGLVGVLGKGGTKAGLKFLKNFISPIVKRIPIIGGLIDFALNFFVFKEPIGRAAFAAIGATIFGALGATAGSIIPVAGNFVGGALGGLAGDVAGKWLYDTFFDKKKPVEMEDDTKTQAPSPPATPYPRGLAKDVSVSGGNIVNIGKDLIGKGFSVAEHPDFTKTPTPSGGTYTPGKGTVSNVHKGRGHYEGRAIDVTNWRGGDPEYKQAYLPVLNSLENNPAIKMLIHDTWGFYKDGKKSGPGSYGHPQHMHIEVKDQGGFIGKGMFQNKGGMEFVLDHDTTKAIEQTLPGFLNAFNKAEGKDAVEVLRSYADYEMPEVIPVPVMQPAAQSNMGSYGGEDKKMSLPNIASTLKDAFNDILYMR